MTDDDKDPSRTVWGSIEVLTKAVLHMQEKLDAIKKILPHQKIALEKVDKPSHSGVYEAKIVNVDDKTIATLPSIGYHMLNGELIIRDHITAEEIKIPKNFHYLKIVKFSCDDYKLTFCNTLGNEFFEYKKYDPQYSNVSDKYKFVDFSSVKKIYNFNLKEYFNTVPSFLIAEGSIEPGSQNHAVNLFELSQDQKVGTLVDEFSYLDSGNKLNHCNYHKGVDCSTYNSEPLNMKMMNMSQGNKLYFIAEQDTITLHPIMENSCISDLFLL